MENKEQELEEAFPTRLTDAKDELNLAEFPLCSITDRLQPHQKTMVFEDRIWDESRGEMIARQLTITGSDEFGLPTAVDDEILLGLIQISKLQQFADRKVQFTRYQLLQLLGWRDESKNYERIEKSLNRWVGVTLYYKNAWWDRGQQCWADEKFHVLDNVTLFDREKARKQSKAGDKPQLHWSTFIWNDVIFRSFNVGNLKSIDFDFFKRLESSVAKRLYRFLGKRFFHRPHWEFDLKELCWEHVGLSRNYTDAANLKRKLKTGLVELEREGFLAPLSDEERFRKVSSGQWRVIIEEARLTVGQQEPPLSDEVHALEEALVRRGITPAAARETVATHPVDRVRSQLEVFDWLVSRKDSRVSRNPAGFLITSIKTEFTPPSGFVGADELARRKVLAQERKRRDEARAKELVAREEAKRMAREQAIADFWQSVSEEERSRMGSEAMAQANALERDVLARGGAFAIATRQGLLDSYALKMLQAGG